MPSSTLTQEQAQQEQVVNRATWDTLLTLPKSNRRSGLLASTRKDADAIAEEYGVPSLLPDTESSSGGDLAKIKAEIRAKLAEEQEDTEDAESTPDAE